MTTFHGPSISIDHLDELHGFLTARGWELDERSHCDADGQPDDPETLWCYPDTFGGIAMHRIDDVTPYQLTCRFSFEGDGLGIVIGAAGNYKGCVKHAEKEHPIAVEGNQLDLHHVAALLDVLELHARQLDPRELIECRFFGRCGENNALL